MSASVQTGIEIVPFHVEFPDDALDDLHRRVAEARWPSTELVGDHSQGVQLAPLPALVAYWRDNHDWRACEARLNALPQFTTKIDGLDIYFVHVKSRHEHALPLIITHGWPGSVIELLEVVGPLTDPTAHGGRGRGRLRPRGPVTTRLRLLRGAHGSRLGSRPHGRCLGGVDETARLHALRRPGR